MIFWLRDGRGSRTARHGLGPGYGEHSRPFPFPIPALKQDCPAPFVGSLPCKLKFSVPTKISHFQNQHIPVMPDRAF